MKKFIVLLFVFLVFVSCQKPLKDRGIIEFKFTEKVDVKAMMDGLSIESTENDKMVQELYVVKVRGCKDKIYVSQFCYEDIDIGEEIIFSECGDIRFETSY